MGRGWLGWLTSVDAVLVELDASVRAAEDHEVAPGRSVGFSGGLGGLVGGGAAGHSGLVGLGAVAPALDDVVADQVVQAGLEGVVSENVGEGERLVPAALLGPVAQEAGESRVVEGEDREGTVLLGQREGLLLGRHGHAGGGGGAHPQEARPAGRPNAARRRGQRVPPVEGPVVPEVLQGGEKHVKAPGALEKAGQGVAGLWGLGEDRGGRLLKLPRNRCAEGREEKEARRRDLPQRGRRVTPPPR